MADVIVEITKLAQIIELSEEIVRLANNVIPKIPDLKHKRPEIVATSILKYFLHTNGFAIDDPQAIAKYTGKSDVAINRMFLFIAAIDNN